MMTTTRVLTGRDIALAHSATRAVLETVLAEAGITFEQSVQLNAIADNGGTIERDQLEQRLVGGLKIDRDTAHRAVDSLLGAGLATSSTERPVTIQPTASGLSVHRQVLAGTDRIVDTLYTGLPADELTVTQRILATLTERANRELERSGPKGFSG